MGRGQHLGFIFQISRISGDFGARMVQWKCAACTLLNPSHASECDACGAQQRVATAVRLHCYDVGDMSAVETANRFGKIVGAVAYHTGIEVFGKEFSFGFVEQGTGVFDVVPRGCTMHKFKETIDLGSTTLSEHEAWSHLPAGCITYARPHIACISGFCPCGGVGGAVARASVPSAETQLHAFLRRVCPSSGSSSPSPAF